MLWALKGQGQSQTQVFAQRDSEDEQGYVPPPSQVDTLASVEVQITSVRPVPVCVGDLQLAQDEVGLLALCRTLVQKSCW